jgi:hypothetical protein
MGVKHESDLPLFNVSITSTRTAVLNSQNSLVDVSRLLAISQHCIFLINTMGLWSCVVSFCPFTAVLILS